MKRIFIMITMAYFSAFGLSSALSAELKDTFQRELPASGKVDFELSNINGNVEVIAGSSDKIIIHAEKRVHGPTESGCREVMQKLTVDIKETGERIKVKQIHSEKMFYDVSINYQVTLPVQMNAFISTTNGNIECTDRTAELELNSTNGSIEVTNCSGVIKANTSNGNINANCSSSRAEFETSNGTLSLRVDLSGSGKLKAETSNGNVKLSIPKNSNGSFRASTTNGRIDIDDFEKSIRLNKEETDAEGSIGDGSGSINLSTTNGNIKVKSY